ncbi:unnamed protein product [Ectocarpus sp. 6 AP-2014]
MSSSRKTMLAVATAATALSALLAGKGSMVGATAAAAGEDGSCPAGGEDSSCTTTATTRAAPEETAVAATSPEEGGFFSRFSFPSLGSLFGSPDPETCLPQDPKADTSGRKKRLAKAQKEYPWRTRGTPIDMPFLEGFPPNDELPSGTWVGKLVSSLLGAVIGTTRGNIGAGEIIEAVSNPAKAKNFATRVSELIKEAKINDRPVDINDYEDLHAYPIKKPDSVFDFDEDDAFARQRLQGPNCVVLEKCSEATRQKLKVLDSDPTYKNLKDKVDSLMKDGKLFVVDQYIVKEVQTAPLEDVPRYLAPCVALFEAVDDELLPLKPVGIQLSQGDTATPIFTPDDGYNWKIAKACFEAADFIIHEVVSHLGNTHVVLEGPMVSMNRQLPKEHPVHALFAPHVEGTALINWGADELLMPADAAVDRLLANKIEDAWALIRVKTLERISKDFSPEVDFAARGMTKTDFPGRYPYRDFGLKYWDAIYTWVKEYLDVYYSTDADITGDYELQAFVNELVTVGEFKWLAEWDNSTDKKGLLAKVLASLIYSASTLHAAVNFPQKTTMSFVPSNPASVYVPPPTDKTERTFEDYLAYLPPLEIATRQVILFTFLGNVFYTTLGDYEADQFSDKRVLAPLAKFQQALEDIETDMVDENALVVSSWRKRGKGKRAAANFGYTTLLPEKVPQSINI